MVVHCEIERHFVSTQMSQCRSNANRFACNESGDTLSSQRAATSRVARRCPCDDHASCPPTPQASRPSSDDLLCKTSSSFSSSSSSSSSRWPRGVKFLQSLCQSEHVILQVVHSHTLVLLVNVRWNVGRVPLDAFCACGVRFLQQLVHVGESWIIS